MNQILLKLLILLFLLNCDSWILSKVSAQTYSNRIIYASLTDKDTGRVWQIQEWVHLSNKKTGRIEIKSIDEQMNVFYLYKNIKDNYKRLVIHDNTCEVYNYDMLTWDKLLPGINKPLTNFILLTGPSILDRFKGFPWKTGNDEIIRGSLMHSVIAVNEGKLNVTLYYESNLDQATGIQQPSQIVFYGYNPDTLVEGEPEDLILDIYLHSQTSQELDKLVQVTPGFGCPIYLNGDHEFPELNSRKVHYIVAEQVKNYATKIIDEVHADEINQIVRLSQLQYGFTREKVFDYSLGINYELSKSGDCSVYPIKPDAPGIDESGSLSIDRLLWLSKSLRYLGEIMFERRSNYNVHVWESVETNKAINGKTYDKVVTTQYLSSSFQNDIFRGYSPVAATIKAYNKNDKGKYVYAHSIHRDYYDSNSDLPESVYHEAFQIADCFKKPEQKMNLKFHLTCKADGCIKKSQNAVYEMRELFKSSLLQNLRISSNRLTEINFEFGPEEIEADVTFIEAPKISDVLHYDVYTLNSKPELKIHETVANEVESCLRYQSRFFPSSSFISYCYSDKTCFSTNNVKDMESPDNRGAMCNVFVDPYKKLNRLGQEKLLSELHDHILGYFGKITFNMNLDGTDKAVAFQVTDVVARIDSSDEESKSPFLPLFTSYNFAPIDGVNTVMVPGVDNFGDCYRTCAQNGDISCKAFSFCQRKDVNECYVSTMKEEEIEYNRTKDSDCRINLKDYLSNFRIRQNLKFKTPTSVAINTYFKRNCAAECYASKDCVSFEYCDSGECTFGGLVTSTNTEYSSTCNIYTPKRSQKYAITGKKLVNQVKYTEVDLDLDQCAALCDDDLSCKSFNFCPKSKSSSQCQITSYSIKDPKAESVESSICHNFELTVGTNKDTVSNNSPDVKTSGVSGGGVFGIIMSCLFIGLFAGFVGSFVAIKVKSKETNRSTENFGWSKQKDEDEDLTTI